MSRFTENLASVRTAAAEDIRTSNIKQTLGFVATAATLAAHESAMIEMLYAVGTQTLEHTGSPLAVGAAMGGFSLAIETGLSYGIANSIETFKHATGKIKDLYFKEQVEEVSSRPDKALKAFDTGLLAVTLGSPGVVLGDYARNPNKSYEENKKTGIRAAVALGGVNATLGLVVAGSAVATEKLGSSVVTDVLVETGHNPYFYGAMFGVVGVRAAIAALKGKRANRSKKS